MKKQQNHQSEQREQIRAFDKELFTYTGQIAWLIPSIFSFVLLILIALPVQGFDKGDGAIFGMMYLFAIWVSHFVLLPYVNVTDTFERQQTGKTKTYDKLKYLPVSKKQFIAVRMGYLFRFLWKLALVGLALQCIFAVVATGRVELVNLAHVLAVMLVAPTVTGWLLLQFWT